MDVTNDFIYLLAEEFQFSTKKGRIAKLSINRKTMVLESFDILLELPTHLSFPNILRDNGAVFVYPENAASGHLDLYEYFQAEERLVFKQQLLNESVWDSAIITYPGEERYLFTAKTDDYHLDIFKWSTESGSFNFYKTVVSKKKDSRMAGQAFEYGGVQYVPFQDCTKNYGGAVIIKEVEKDGESFVFKLAKTLQSPHPIRKEALHTINEYKGVVVIDVWGYDLPIIGPCLHKLVHSMMTRE